MASSKDKAIALKDNYVAGLIEGGVTGPMQGMKEKSFGNVAGPFEDRMVKPSPSNPYGFPDEIRGSEPMPEGFSNWDDDKKSAFFTLPLVDI